MYSPFWPCCSVYRQIWRRRLFHCCCGAWSPVTCAVTQKWYMLSRYYKKYLGDLLPFSMLGEESSRPHFGIFFIFFRENRLWQFMQTVSSEDSLHEISKPVFWENKKNILKCCLLKFWPSMLNVNMEQRDHITRSILLSINANFLHPWHLQKYANH